MEMPDEDLIKFQQDDFFKKLMLKSLEENGDQYFMHLAFKGVKLLPNFYVKNLIQKREPTPL